MFLRDFEVKKARNNVVENIFEVSQPSREQSGAMIPEGGLIPASLSRLSLKDGIIRYM